MPSVATIDRDRALQKAVHSPLRDNTVNRPTSLLGCAIPENDALQPTPTDYWLVTVASRISSLDMPDLPPGRGSPNVLFIR